MIEARQGKRPNILLVVVDDMGYSDIQPFGGEIRTPVLQSLADQGLCLGNFHVSSLCAPTRAMLLSGVDNHVNLRADPRELEDLSAAPNFRHEWHVGCRTAWQVARPIREESRSRMGGNEATRTPFNRRAAGVGSSAKAWNSTSAASFTTSCACSSLRARLPAWPGARFRA